MAGKINGLHIRAITSQDIAGAMFLVESANWNQTPQDWQMLLNTRGTHLVATVKDIIIGSICALEYGSFIWVAMVLVHPEYRRQGIATILMEKILGIYKGRTLRLDATVEGAKVYENFGFYTTQQLFRWKTSRPRSYDLQDQVSPAVLLNNPQQLIEFDKTVFGGDRSAILNWLMLYYPNHCYVIPTKTNPAYVLGRTGTHAWQIGPLVANNLVDANLLLTQVLKRYPDQDFYLDSFSDRQDWNMKLQGCGFTQQRTFLRMQLGSNIVLGDESKQYAVAGPELG
ncbi:MAG: GNAT family N-acetyltransferase [Saprospiraceae bacterium]|nr:GNAT family N-acetyltransferase [Saprospiraceae bacterium]